MTNHQPTQRPKFAAELAYHLADVSLWELAVIVAGVIGLIVGVILAWPFL